MYEQYNLSKLALQVVKILEENEKARNNDGTMVAYYIKKYHPSRVSYDPANNPYVTLNNLQHLTSFESLTRARRIVQKSHGLYPPTDPKVAKARGIKELNYTNTEVREAKNLDIPKPYAD